MSRPKKNKELVLPPMPVPFVPEAPPKLLKLDLGCGKNKKGPEWTGVDAIKFDGVDVVCNLAEETVKSEFVQKNPPRKQSKVNSYKRILHLLNGLGKIIQLMRPIQVILLNI